MRVAIDYIDFNQSKATEATKKKITHLLNYATPNKPAVTRYQESKMLLYVHSDDSYLSQSRSRIK